MLKLSLWQRASKWLALVALFSFVGVGLAMAQAEPTIKQIYEAAESGKVEQAQTMIQQVLIAHPSSARAHFVQAELFARQGLASRGREALATADKLAPGLPFAKPEAVQALRAQLASRPGQSAPKEPANRAFGSNVANQTAPAAPTSSFPLGLGLAIGGCAIALVIFLMRKKPAAEAGAQAAYGGPNNDSGVMGSGVGSGGGIGSGLNGPQTFGNNAGTAMAPPYGQPGYGQPAYGQPAYGQPAGSGMGSRVMGGLATGLAVGAGVMAAQAIGKNLMGNNEHSANLNDGAASNNGYAQPLAGNSDLGGQNFGINDADSWDDGSASADSGGGGDWDT